MVTPPAWDRGEKLARVVVPRRRDHLPGGSLLDHLPGAHDRHPVAQLGDDG